MMGVALVIAFMCIAITAIICFTAYKHAVLQRRPRER